MCENSVVREGLESFSALPSTPPSAACWAIMSPPLRGSFLAVCTTIATQAQFSQTHFSTRGYLDRAHTPGFVLRRLATKNDRLNIISVNPASTARLVPSEKLFATAPGYNSMRSASVP